MPVKCIVNIPTPTAHAAKMVSVLFWMRLAPFIFSVKTNAIYDEMMAVKTDKITKNGLKNSNNTDFISYFVFINIDYYTSKSMQKNKGLLLA
ncbi:hypothetical protein QMA09_09950 [Planococcus sp. APC 3906]|uniref:hypothetical protein n=1 Tax=Planococcus sp. APC 3906 TaxID=3035194 RepID=UPI0025B3DCB1|nr:hypothetical protein [Planococcus sp. APC 3906]MDN3450517.1 hypothetical protein [Planococcus sp. APC 3906]